jgi:C4-dicarboxylate-specific signal transduction histidine kinase
MLKQMARQPGISRLLAALGMLGLLAASVWSSPGYSQTEMTIGVLAFRGKQDALERWGPTAQYLSQSISDHSFKIVPLTLEGMLSRVEQDRLDFILTNTGNYVVLENAFGISRLATLKVRQFAADFTQFGAVIITRRGHPDLNQLEDIAGHSLMAVSEEAFGGFQMAWRELIDVGIDPFEDLQSLQFAGFPQDDIVHAVIAGEVDAGTVRSGTIERMAADGLIDIEQIRVLGSRDSKSFPFLHSTRLYPEWPFAKARKTSQELAQRVAIALLQMKPDSEAATLALSAGWTIALDYGPVHELFQELEIGPYAYLKKPELALVWREYKGWIIFSLAMVLVLVTLLVLIGRVNRRISQSELKYREEANQRKQAQELLASHKENLEVRVEERTAELAEVNTSLRRSEAALRAMHDITTDADRGFDDKLESLLSEGCRFFGMEFAMVTGATESGEGSICRVGSDAESSWQEPMRICERLRDEIKTLQQPVAIADFSAYSFQDGSRDLSGSAIGADYRVNDETAGFILYSSSNAVQRVFSDVDIDILQLMAQWLGGELERSEINLRAQEHQAHLAHVSRLNTMGEMATGIAHELNQPLTAILNYSSGSLRLLQKNGDDDTALKNAIENIGNDARRAAGIIKRLREFIKRSEHRPERFLLRDCIEPAVELLRPRLDQHQIDVDVSYAADVSDVLADRIQIEQVLVNLLLNSIDSLQHCAQASGKIMVRVDSGDKGDISIGVSDTGKGLAADVVDHLFDPFFTTKTEGMGMGLSISRSIIESHGGTIEYLVNEFQQPTFRFTLPTT